MSYSYRIVILVVDINEIDLLLALMVMEGGTKNEQGLMFRLEFEV